jgi:hypothetical protein
VNKPNKYAHMADGTVIVMLERRDGTVLPCFVDAADWEKVRGHRWSARKDRHSKDRHRFYAISGVRRANDKRASLRMHRILLPDVKEVDHENGNGLNNRRINLRPATRSQNNANSCKRSNGLTSQFKGVCLPKDRKKFLATIAVNGNRKYLGTFTSELDAARAYDAAAFWHFGEFARLNFPQEKAA